MESVETGRILPRPGCSAPARTVAMARPIISTPYWWSGFYDLTLSVSTILDHVQNGRDMQAKGLRVYFPLDEGSGNFLPTSARYFCTTARTTVLPGRLLLPGKKLPHTSLHLPPVRWRWIQCHLGGCSGFYRPFYSPGTGDLFDIKTAIVLLKTWRSW